MFACESPSMVFVIECQPCPLDGNEQDLGDGGDGVHDHIKLSVQPWREGVGKQAQRQRYNARALLLPANVQ